MVHSTAQSHLSAAQHSTSGLRDGITSFVWDVDSYMATLGFVLIEVVLCGKTELNFFFNLENCNMELILVDDMLGDHR
jgi:hypothetical protein